MLLEPAPRVDPCALDFRIWDVDGDDTAFAVDVRNLGTCGAEQIVVRLEIEDVPRLPERLVVDRPYELRDGGVCVPSLASGETLRITGRLPCGTAAETMQFARASLWAGGSLAGSVERTLARAPAAEPRNVTPALVALTSNAPANAREQASLAFDRATIVPGERFTWTLTATLGGEPFDDVLVDVHADGCVVDRTSMRVVHDGAVRALAASEKAGFASFRVPGLAATDGFVVNGEATVAVPAGHGDRAVIAATLRRAGRAVQAEAEAAVDSRVRFANEAEAIVVLDPLVAGATARIGVALVNVGTATARNVRLVPRIDGLADAAIRSRNPRRDTVDPGRTEFVEARVTIPAPLSDGTSFAIVAEVRADGCEPTIVRRLVRARSAPAFAADGNRAALCVDGPLRPAMAIPLALTIANTGTDRAQAVAVRFVLPDWLAADTAAEGAFTDGILTVGEVAANTVTDVQVGLRVGAHAPAGLHRVPLTLTWDGGRCVLAPLELTVETAPAFDEASLASDTAEEREPDDLIAYRLAFRNTGDGECGEIAVRAMLDGPAAYARASLAVNGRRVRDTGSASALFGDGIIVESVPVRAEVILTWTLRVDADVTAPARVTCRVMLSWGEDQTTAVDAVAIGVRPADAFPVRAVALPARIPHAAIREHESSNPSRSHAMPVDAAPVVVAPYPVASPVDAEQLAVLFEYLERARGTSGIVAVLDLRVFLPLRPDPVGSTPEAAAAWNLVRSLDRLYIAVRVTGRAVFADEVIDGEAAAALRALEIAHSQWTTGDRLLCIAERLATIPDHLAVTGAFHAYRETLIETFRLWAARGSEIDDLLQAPLPPTVAQARESLMDAIARALPA